MLTNLQYIAINLNIFTVDIVITNYKPIYACHFQSDYTDYRLAQTAVSDRNHT
jgi:hypothetical protein